MCNVMMHQGKSVEIRQAAGLLLKNNLKGGYSSMAQENRKYIKSELLPCLGAVDRHIRTKVGTIISEIVNIDGVSGRLELLPALVTWMVRWMHCQRYVAATTSEP